MRALRFILSLSLLVLTFVGCEDSSLNEKIAESVGTGSVTGKVVNGATGLGILNAIVYVVGNQAGTQTATDASGNYTIANLSTGAQTVHAELASYNSDQVPVTVVRDVSTDNINLSLLPTAYSTGKYTVSLTWNSLNDLDTHLWVPDGSPYTEVYWGALGDNDGTLDSTPFAGLDVDDTDGYGPETLSVLKTAGGFHYNGAYRYYVHNYTSDGTLATSGATVKVYDNGTLIKTYHVPAGAGEFWHVFDVSGSTFTDVNVIDAVAPAHP